MRLGLSLIALLIAAVAGCKTTDSGAGNSSLQDASASSGSAAGCANSNAAVQLPAGALPIPIRHQPNKYTCGPTSLSAILAFWQVQFLNQTKLDGPLNTSKANGTDPWMIRNYATSQGLTAQIHGIVDPSADAGTLANLNAPLPDTSTDDLRHALCVGAYQTPDCQPVTVMLDLQAWGTGDSSVSDGQYQYAGNYPQVWESGHYVVLAGIDADDTGNVYFMDPDDTDNTKNKAYSYIPISDPGVGLLARWHDYFGTNPNSAAGGAPPTAQQWLDGAIFISPGTAGVARTTFETLAKPTSLDSRRPDASPDEICTLMYNLVKTY